MDGCVGGSELVWGVLSLVWGDGLCVGGGGGLKRSGEGRGLNLCEEV